MALPTSGQLSINDIRTELGVTSGSFKYLHEYAAANYGLTQPLPETNYRISDFYGFVKPNYISGLASSSAVYFTPTTTAQPFSMVVNYQTDFFSNSYAGYAQTPGSIYFSSWSNPSHIWIDNGENNLTVIRNINLGDTEDFYISLSTSGTGYSFNTGSVSIALTDATIQTQSVSSTSIFYVIRSSGSVSQFSATLDFTLV